MRKNDLVDLRVTMASVLEAIGALERSDAYWEDRGDEFPNSLPEVGRLRQKLFALSQAIIRAKRMPKELEFKVRY